MPVCSGRKTKQVRNTTTTTYTYDNADRLTGQQVTGARATFVMDAVGNITVKSQEGNSPQTMTYNAAQRLTTMQQGTTRTTYTYDNNGNTTVEQVGTTRTTSTYDRENRMTLQQVGTARTTYAYDGDGLRRRIVTSGGTTTCAWDGELMQVARGNPLTQPALMGYQGPMIASALSAERRTTYVCDDKGQVVTVIYPKPEAVLRLTKPLTYQGRCGDVARHEAPTSVSIPGRNDYAYSDREGGPLRSQFTDSNHRRVMIYDTKASAGG